MHLPFLLVGNIAELLEASLLCGNWVFQLSRSGKSIVPDLMACFKPSIPTDGEV